MKSPIKKHKRGVDLTKVFKPEDLKRLQYNADEDIVGTLFDGLATNTYFGSKNPGPTKKLKIERAKSMYHEGYELSKKITLNLKKPISFENSLESQMSDEISDSQDIQKKDPNFYQFNDERPNIKDESYTKVLLFYLINFRITNISRLAKHLAIPTQKLSKSRFITIYSMQLKRSTI